MSNFSNIGFPVGSEDELVQLVESTLPKSRRVEASNGHYLVYSDPSGAELWTQVNSANELVGANPHFVGESRRNVCITSAVERAGSELDGAFHGWAQPSTPSDPDSGEYPFVFDVPDFRTIGDIDFPRDFTIQLSAFAQELDLYADEDAYYSNQSSEPLFAVESFIPSGLFSSEGESVPDPPQAFGILTGRIKQAERRRNSFTNSELYWVFVDTLGGEVDVVADPDVVPEEPRVGGIVQGQFWLSARLINPPRVVKKDENRSILRRLFGN